MNKAKGAMSDKSSRTPGLVTLIPAFFQSFQGALRDLSGSTWCATEHNLWHAGIKQMLICNRVWYRTYIAWVFLSFRYSSLHKSPHQIVRASKKRCCCLNKCAILSVIDVVSPVTSKGRNHLFSSTFIRKE